MASAMRRTCASDSITQGPAVRNSSPVPTCTGPISKDWLTGGFYRGSLRMLRSGKHPMLRAATGPLPQRALERVQRRGTGQIVLWPYQTAFCQSAAEGDVLCVELHVVTSVANRFQ